jgi:hypothetical protein
LAGWRARGDELVATQTIAASLCSEDLPRCNVAWREVPGRSGVLACQDSLFLS